jgi:hypothetical protein
MYLNLVIHTPVGVFAGTTNRESAPVSDITDTIASIQRNADNLSYFVLYVDDSEILIPGEVFKNSVTRFVVSDHPITTKDV